MNPLDTIKTLADLYAKRSTIEDEIDSETATVRQFLNGVCSDYYRKFNHATVGYSFHPSVNRPCSGFDTIDNINETTHYYQIHVTLSDQCGTDYWSFPVAKDPSQQERISFDVIHKIITAQGKKMPDPQNFGGNNGKNSIKNSVLRGPGR